MKCPVGTLLDWLSTHHRPAEQQATPGDEHALQSPWRLPHRQEPGIPGWRKYSREEQVRGCLVICKPKMKNVLFLLKLPKGADVSHLIPKAYLPKLLSA